MQHHKMKQCSCKRPGMWFWWFTVMPYASVNQKQGIGCRDISSCPAISPPNNCAIFTIAQVMSAVMSSAMKTELVALFIKAKCSVQMWQMLEEMRHLQPLTLVQTDNSTANSIITDKNIPKAMKEMDIRFHRLCDRDASRILVTKKPVRYNQKPSADKSGWRLES